MKFYLAGPLFSMGEISTCLKVKEKLLNAGIDVLWPGDLLPPGDHSKDVIFRSCLDGLKSCDGIVAILDGTQVDDGTSWEIGFGYSRRYTIFGLRTDFRNAGDTKNSMMNAMIEESCYGIYRDIDALVADLTEYVNLFKRVV